MNNPQSFSVEGIVEIFPMENPWVYISVPVELSDLFSSFANRGLVPITITLGSSTWDTSLMPKGDGTQFIPLNAKVRKKEHIAVGDPIVLSFKLRGY